MKKSKYLFIIIFLVTLTSYYSKYQSIFIEEDILSYTVNPVTQNLQLYWKNKEGERYKNANILKAELAKNNQSLVFAMNGGMYKKDGSPLGLYIEEGKILTPLNTIKDAYGNFYLQPNGIFYLSKSNIPTICKTTDFVMDTNIKFATQSGPMLVIDDQIHTGFTNGSTHLNIRNGVGILPNGDLLFAMSKAKINLYDFSMFFKKNGCTNALYLDGFVSKTYLPSKNFKQMSGNFGVIIAEIK